MLNVNFKELRTGFLSYLPFGSLIGLVLLIEIGMMIGTWKYKNTFIKTSEIKINNKRKIKEELGDLLFSCINLSRKLGLDTETIIRNSNRKFEKRFKKMEHTMNKKKLKWNLNNLEREWQKSK